MCLCVMKDEEEKGRRARRGEQQQELCLNYLFFFLLSSLRAKALPTTVKINYGEDGQTGKEEGEETATRKEKRGVSGKRSNEKTSDFWASHRQPSQGLNPHTCTHTVASVCLQHALCVEIRTTKFHIPVIAFSISSCELGA